MVKSMDNLSQKDNHNGVGIAKSILIPKLYLLIAILIIFSTIVVINAFASGPQQNKEFICQMSPRVENLSYSCQYNNAQCQLLIDNTEGLCRSMVFSTPDGLLGLQTCFREDLRYELYRQYYPHNATNMRACMGAGCVDTLRGYDSFTSQQLPPVNHGYCYISPSLFTVSCNVQNCTENYDETVGTCRTLVHENQDGVMGTLVCHKGDNRYELYRRFYLGTPFEVCVQGGCVDGVQGYDSFIVNGRSPNQDIIA